MKCIYFLFFILCFPFLVIAQKANFSTVSTLDIDHFWEAFDSVATTSDKIKQTDFIQHLYVDKATPGLIAFMSVRDYNAKLWVKLINKYPKFWKDIRKNTLNIKDQVPAITKSINNFRELYPEMRPSKMYFTIGGLNSGGTTTRDMVLIGAEIAAAEQKTDASELGDWLINVFRNQYSSNLVSLNMHEYVHTQQKFGEGQILLEKAIKEGAADFIAELVTHKKNNSAYMIYGRKNEKEIKEKFWVEMFGKSISNWLYNGSNSPNPDLGYFVGYRICKAYYNCHKDKRQAIKKIIELNYNHEDEITDFLKESGYYLEPFDKRALLKNLQSQKQ